MAAVIGTGTLTMLLLQNIPEMEEGVFAMFRKVTIQGEKSLARVFYQ